MRVRYVTYVSYVTLQLTLRYVPPDSARTYVRSLRARPSTFQQPHRSVAYLLHVATQASSTEPQEQSSEPQIMPATAQRARGYFKKYSYIFIRIGPRAVAIHTRTEQARMQHYHQNRCLPCRVRAGRPMPSPPNTPRIFGVKKSQHVFWACRRRTSDYPPATPPATRLVSVCSQCSRTEACPAAAWRERGQAVR